MASGNEQNRIPEKDALRLISAHDGNVALLYVWQVLHPSFDAEQAAADLCLTSSEIRTAKEKLDRLFSSELPALNPVSVTVPLPPAPDEMPRYSETDIRQRLQEGSEFQIIVGETGRIVGHTLSTPDMEILLQIYDHLAIPPEVIMELIHYCAERNTEKFGPSKRLSVKTIQREAFRWVEEDILSFEAAENYISQQKTLRKDIAELAEILSLRPQDLTSTQEKYLRTWVDMGFEAAAVAEAHDRTVLNTGKLSWPYLDKILQAWHSRGLHSLREIQQKDTRRPSKKQSGKTPRNDVPVVRPEDFTRFISDKEKEV